MKQDKAKRTPKWLLPVVIAAAVLVVAGVLLAIFLNPGEQQQGEPGKIQSDLYWNVDKSTSVDPETGISNREPDANGLYTIRFAVNGEHVEFKAADKRLVNNIDFMDVMGLVFDADGLIIEAVNPTVIYKEVAKDFYVKSVSEDKIVANSSIAMNGMEVEIPLSAATGVFNVNPANQVVGQKDTCQIMDKILVYGNEEGVTTHVFIKERVKGDGAYFRVDQFYDKAKGETTRVPDENGAYSILFAYEGEQLNLKCKDKALVSKIDSLSDTKNIIGLIFDEEGYIVDYVDVAVALRGKMLGRLMNVTKIDGNTVTIEDLVGAGADGSMDLIIDADCDIFMIENECEADFIGQRVDSLQLGDMVWVYGDLEGKPILIYIQRRVCDDFDMYYSMSRKYDTEKQETTREPDENGWYVFDMITKGKRVEMRTKSKEIASRVDSFQYKLVGLKTSGTTILDVCGPYCLSGYSHVGINRFVTQVVPPFTRIVSSSNFESGNNYMMADGHIMIDATGDFSAKPGSQVTLREGDRVTAYTDPSKMISHGVVTNRYYADSKLYYNVTRQYDSTLKETTRVPNEEGYYVFNMICEGKEVQVKTKDKAMATYIDSDSYSFRALTVSNGIIKGAYQNVSALKYSVRALANYFYDSTNADGTINYYYMSDGKRVDKTTTYKLSDKTVVYNYSSAANKVGEKTTLKKGDKLQAFASMETQEMLVMFVLERKVESKLYWHVSRKYNSTTMETTQEPDEAGYYQISVISEDGEILNFKTKDKAVASKTYSFATAFGLTLDGDVIVKAHDYTSVKGIAAYAAGYYDAMKITSSKISFVRNRPASASTGRTAEYPVIKGYKVVNVSSYSPNYGGKDKVEVGDRLASFMNENGQIVCTFIVNENTHKDGAISKCPHCGKDVWWEPFAGTVYAADCHYYLPKNYDSSNKTVGYTAEQLAADPNLVQYELVFDLNGYSWNTTNYKIALSDKTTILDTVGGGRLQLGGEGVLNVKNTTINCDVNAIGTSTVKLEGKVETAKDTKIKLDSGILLDISQLSADSKITVSAKGVFTTERDDIDKYLDVFKPDSESGKIEVVGNALTYVQEQKEYTTEQIIEIANSAEFAANFANGGIVTAVCPVCGVEEEWTPIGAGSAEAPKTSQQKITGHVYYDKDTWTTSVNILTGDTATGCVYLNGKTVTGIGRIRANKAINIMGPGKIIKSNDTATENDENALFVLDSANTKLNVYGGEYINNKADKPLFEMVSTSSKGIGKIYAGSFESAGAAVHMANAEAKLELLGGTIKGDAAQIEAGSLTIGSVNVQSDVVAAMPATVILTGKPNVTGALDLSSGALATLTDLDTGASILVKANGTFTQNSDKAAEYITAQTFKIPTGYQDVRQEGNALWTAPEGYVPPESTTPNWSDNVMDRIDQWTAYYGDEFAAAGKTDTVFTEICPVCGARNVTWESRNSTYTTLTVTTEAKHYFLSEDYGRTTQEMLGTAQAAPGCIYLNNKTFTTIGRFLIKNQLNIFDDNQTAGGGITKIVNTYVPDSKTAYLPMAMLSVTAGGELNIYGGHYEAQQPLVAGLNDNGTDVIAADNSTSKVNIYGGTFANTGHGVVLNASSGDVNISGGNIAGKVLVAAEANVTLSGAPVISGDGLDLTSGAKITITDLETAASVAVKANGVFTEATNKAADYVTAMTFSVPEGYQPVDVLQDVLWTDVEGAAAPEYPSGGETPPVGPENPPVGPENPPAEQTPEQQLKAKVDAWVAANKDAFTAGENLPTSCPFCGETGVTWEAKANKTGTMKAGHFYLKTGYVSYTNMNMVNMDSTVTATTCVYLNGQNAEIIGRMKIYGGATLNVFGEGTITKLHTDKGAGGSSDYTKAAIFDINNTATVNIYGGTYISNQKYVEVSGAVSNPTGTPVIDVRGAATVNVYGAAFQTAADANGEVIRSSAASTINLYAATVTGGTATHPNSIYMQAGNLTIGDVTVTGNVAVAEGAAITLTGKPNVTGTLDLTSGVKATLVDLDAEASVTVKANGAFTAQNDKAAQYAAAFKPAAGYRDVVEFNKVLWTAPAAVDAAAQQIIDTANSAAFAANFANGGTVTAVCPVCGGEAVQWTPIGSESASALNPIAPTSQDAKHFYISESFTYTGSYFVRGGSAYVKPCLYLNGKTVTITKGSVLVSSGLNLLGGNGSIIKDDSTKVSGFFRTSGTATDTVNIYGGTYESSNVETPLFRDGSRITWNLYGAEFKYTGAETATTLLTNAVNSNFNLHSGSIDCGNGKFDVANGKVNLLGGTFKGDLHMNVGALTVGSATVLGDVTVAAENATITLTGAPLILGNLDLTNGVKATVTELTEHTSVTVKANGTFTAVTDKATQYAPYFIAADGYKPIEVKENALWTEQAVVMAVQQDEQVAAAVKA